MKLPNHFLVSEGDGGLYDTRKDGWSEKPVRPVYSRHFREINSTAELKACLRAGEFTFPGCYPLYFITDDGEALSFESARKEIHSVLYSIRHKSRDGWRVIACEVNYEDGELACAHSGKRIPSAYCE